MRRRQRRETGSMDSLLDTVTNVVGILVILLAVTQIGVATAVRRIQENLPEVGPEMLRQSQEAYESAQDEVASLEREFRSLGKEPPADPAALEALRRQVADLVGKATKLPEKPPDLERLRQQIQKNDKRAADLKKQIEAAEKRLAQLKAQLDKTPEPAVPPPTVVHLPDPRPAPDGARALHFICREGRCLYIQEDLVVEKAMNVIRGRARDLVHHTDRDKYGRVKRVVFSGPKLEALFKRTAVGTPNFDLGIRVGKYATRPALEIRPRDGRGETVDQLESANSRCARLMAAARRGGNYVRFLVWPDGYEAYLAARRIADRYGVPAGWLPQTGSVWRTTLSEVPIQRQEEPPPKPATDPKDDKAKDLPKDVID